MLRQSASKLLPSASAAAIRCANGGNGMKQIAIQATSCPSTATWCTSTGSVSNSPRLFSTKGTTSESKSTSSTSSSTTSSSKCPFSQARELSSDAAATLGMDGQSTNVTENSGDEVQTLLQKVPSWPVVGSFFEVVPFIGSYARQYYNVPHMTPNNTYDFYAAMADQYGDFYALDIPGMGITHFLKEPSEMMKVIRQEGSYPRGGIQGLTPFIKWARDRNLNLVKGDDNGFFGQGETWRTVRTFMQSDLLSPQAAREYVPGVVEAAQIASKGAKHYADDLNLYLNYVAFDMFQTIMFGELTKVSDPNTPSEPVNEVFVKNSVDSLALLIRQISDKEEVIKSKLGITTKMYLDFEAAMDVVNEIAKDKISAFKDKWDRGELNEAEKASYVARAFERQKKEGKVSKDEMAEIVMFALNAGVDTTSTFICWAMVHLSLNPEIQQRLYEELKQNVDENGGSLSSAMLSKKNSPYLHNVLRESHRLTPVMPTVMIKANSNKDIEIHGTKFAQGTLFGFDSYTLGIDPNVVEDPDVFIPDRWTDEATKARKGTRAEALDHQFYKDPFSQGARRCPGSRVAVNETLVILAQLVLDWQFEPDDSSIKSFKDINYEQKTLLVPELPKMTFSARA